jgi:hypothetical protein
MAQPLGIVFFPRKLSEGCGCDLVVEHSPSMHETLDLVPSTERKKKLSEMSTKIYAQGSPIQHNNVYKKEA